MPEDTVPVPETLDRVALDVMSVGLDDLSGLGRVHTGLESLRQAVPADRPLFGLVCVALADLAEKVILDECEGQASPLDTITRGISALQLLQQAFERQGKEEPADVTVAPGLFTLLGIAADPGPAVAVEPGGQSAPPQEEPTVDATMASAVASASTLKAPPAATAAQSVVDADIFFDFVTEAEEHLGTAESSLLALETDPGDAETLNAIFRAFHTIKGAAGFLNLQDVTHVAHAVEDVLDSARKGKLQITSPILDVALQAIDLLKLLLAGLQAQVAGGQAPVQDVAGFVARVEAAASGGGQPGPAGPPAAAPPDGTPAEAPSEPPAAAVAAKEGAAQAQHQDQYFVRVGTAKLDQLVNMVGELVIAETQVSLNPDVLRLDNEKLTRDIAQLNRITRDIQEVAMSMRMVPIRPTFERMARMVRDLARKLDKEVVFHMSGEETELDKNMVEEIVDPLIHMVRNAVDHGVEMPAERRAAGKPEKGTVILEAYHQGGSVVIELRDDGKGLDRDRILQKAVERGLAKGDEVYTDEQVYDFLFRPGFSLAKSVSDISGRGVGMDVVRRSIEKLRGKVEVRSELGHGSTFTIRLPLTLAIIDGMVVGVGKERYVLPLTSIVRSLRPSQAQISRVLGQAEMVQVLGELFPLVRLHLRFGLEAKHRAPWEGLVVITEAEAGRCGLLVDELLGIQQVVIKGLEEDLRNDRGLAGCTILGDGRVGLILDANGLVMETKEQNNGKSHGNDIDNEAGKPVDLPVGAAAGISAN